MAYKTTNNTKIGTRAISARLRRDLIDYLEMQGLNKNEFINQAVDIAVRMHQHFGELPEKVVFKPYFRQNSIPDHWIVVSW